MLIVAFFLNSAIAPNGLEVSMGARETVCSSFVLLVKADNCRKELVKFVRLRCGALGKLADLSRSVRCLQFGLWYVQSPFIPE